MTNTKINSIKINSITETNDNCIENRHKCQLKVANYLLIQVFV